MLRWLDSLAFSSGVAAAVAAALCAATCVLLGRDVQWVVVALAACGTSAIYNLDRLRDLERDRHTAPKRCAFVARHAAVLGGWAVLCAASGAVLAVALGPLPCLLCGVAAVPGVLHRRLKRVPVWKGAYVTAAWLVVVVGLPATGFPSVRAASVAWLAGVVGCALLANLAASSLRDRESLASFVSPRTALAWARSLAALGCALALLAPASLRASIWIPLTEGLSLVRFRDGERYGHWAVDGALAVGALLAIAHRAA